jgi:hypothetical protein
MLLVNSRFRAFPKRDPHEWQYCTGATTGPRGSRQSPKFRYSTARSHAPSLSIIASTRLDPGTGHSVRHRFPNHFFCPHLEDVLHLLRTARAYPKHRNHYQSISAIMIPYYFFSGSCTSGPNPSRRLGNDWMCGTYQEAIQHTAINAFLTSVLHDPVVASSLSHNRVSRPKDRGTRNYIAHSHEAKAPARRLPFSKCHIR